jgi:hypothetical protein
MPTAARELAPNTPTIAISTIPIKTLLRLLIITGVANTNICLNNFLSLGKINSRVSN